MLSIRAKKFFGDIVPEECMNTEVRLIDRVDWDLINNTKEELNEAMWDAFNGRGKRAAKKVTKNKTADEYYLHPEDAYVVDWNTEIEKALVEVGVVE